MTKRRKLVDPERYAERFDHLRKAHQTELAEDYVELIADLIDINGEARITDLAERFGVSHATVNKTVARLQRDGYVESKPYRAIFLTDAGRKMADESRKRHEIVLEFLKCIGVSNKTAEIDSEGIEHHCSDETLGAFKKFIAAHKKENA